MDATATGNQLKDALDVFLKYLGTPQFWLSVIIVVVAVILWQLLKRLRKRWNEKNGGMSTASHVFFDVARFLFIFILILILLSVNGVNVTVLTTTLGVVSVVVGLALQDFLKDIIMGVHILIDKFYRVGDVIRYNGVEGVVISFNVRTTKIKIVTYNEIMTISNRNISEITVLSDMFDLDIGLPYYIDAKKIHDTMLILEERIRHIEGVKEAKYKGTEKFNESSITYRMRYWTEPDGRRFDVKRAINMVVQDGLKEYGIPFPYNHLDVEIVEKKQSED